jgi:hypothetical protein
VTVSDADKAYFARIGAIKNELREEAARSHTSLSLSERLEKSWALSLAASPRS